MKKSLSLPLKSFGNQIGPPSVKPYWFHLNGSLEGRNFENAYCVASILSLRKNSKSAPWYWLVPDLVSTLIWVASRPNSAGYTPVCTLNSCSASMEGRTTKVLKFGSVFSTPSSV